LNKKTSTEKENRIGVFVCHCGLNIAGTVDIQKVMDEISKYPNVVICKDNKYLCSDPGQNLIQTSIKEQKLNAVVVAACSPSMHETTFRDACKRAGLNPYLCEIANIREQCSWVHNDTNKATKKAVKIIKTTIEKVKLNEQLFPISVPVNKKCLVIGGGISGIQAALDVADKGYSVILVEKNASIGGHMAQLSETFPTLDCSQCILTPKMVSVSKHSNIRILAYSEILEISGYVGNFRVKILKKPRYVIEDKCNLCGDCEKVCPVVVPKEFDVGLNVRRAIYIPFPQAVPSTYTLDTKYCLGLVPLRCDKCKRACDAGAIDYDMSPEVIEENVGAIIVATGYDLYPKEKIAEYGYGQYEDVIDGLQFERMLSASGPTGGKIRRPSDGKEPKNIVFVQCVGSRDPEHHLPYCSKICCMYTAKHALLYKHRVPDGKVSVFYMDIRAGGKNYEEFVQHCIENEKVLYYRGRVSKIFQDGDKLMVWGEDTLTNRKIEIPADLVVLAMAMVPTLETSNIAKMLKISTDTYGFLSEAHPKLRPVESLTAGIYLAGANQAPKDIPEAVAQGSAAASKAATIVSADKLYHEPTVAKVDEDICSGCGVCNSVCPYSAIKVEQAKGVSEVNEVLCEGCGTCAAACPSNAVTLKNLASEQIYNMIKAALEGAE